VIYEIKTEVFAIQNCLSKGLGLQCMLVQYCEILTQKSRERYTCHLTLLVCTFGMVYHLVSVICVYCTCTSTSSIYASFLFEVLGLKVHSSFSNLHLCSFHFCLMIAHSYLTYSVFAFLKLYLDFFLWIGMLDFQLAQWMEIKPFSDNISRRRFLASRPLCCAT
jgi:hypothetical protein